MKTMRLIALALAALGAALLGHGHHTAVADGEYGTLYIDVLPDANNTATAFGPIDVCRDTDDGSGPLDIGDTFSIDIVIAGANDLAGPCWILYYNKDVLKVTAYDWTNWKMGPYGMIDATDSVPDTDGAFWCHYVNLPGVNGDGVLLRVTLQAVANGRSDLTITASSDLLILDLACSKGIDHSYPEVLVHDPPGNVRVAVGEDCPEPVPATGGGSLPAVGRSASVWPIALLLAGGVTAVVAVAALVALSAGAWYARRRWQG